MSHIKAVKIEDGDSTDLVTVNAAGALMQIDHESQHVLDGEMYSFTDYTTLGAAGTRKFLITTDASHDVHLRYKFTFNGTTTIELYEGCDRTGTNRQTLYDRNRQTVNTPNVTVDEGVSGGTTDGTLIWSMQIKATTASKVTQGDLPHNIWLLAASEKYLLVITSDTVANVVGSILNLFEES